MCLGSIAVLVEAWDDGGARVGRLDDGCVVSLAFVPDAAAGAHLLVHLGIPVEVLDPDAAARRSPCEPTRRSRPGDMTTRGDRDRASPSSTASSAASRSASTATRVTHFGDATVYTTAKNAVAGVAARRCSLLAPRRAAARASRAPATPDARVARAARASR